MQNESAFRCLDVFSGLDGRGRHKTFVYVGDSPDAKNCSSLLLGHVVAARRIEEPQYGHIDIRTKGRTLRFYKHDRTINGRRAYLFRPNRRLHFLAPTLNYMT